MTRAVPLKVPLDVRIVPVDKSGATSIACVTARNHARFDRMARGECANCGASIMFQPETPAHLEKLCFSCALQPFALDPET